MAGRTRDIDSPETKEASVKKPGTILVCNVPSELSQNDIWIHFQKKKNSGGEVIGVSMKAVTREALVHFEDCEVAKAVVQHQGHVIKGHAINVKLYDEDKDKKSRTVLVSGLPNDATKESIIIHFQKKKIGGGEVEDVEVLENGKALVVFEALKVATAIVNTKQSFKGNAVLTLEAIDMEWDSIKAAEQEDTDFAGKENRTVVVSNLPTDVTKNGVFIYFQKKKNKGGEVEKVTLLPETNEACVIFEDPKVAEAVASTNQKILGKQVRVKLLKAETQPVLEPTDRSVTPATSLVSGLPEGATEHSIANHFERETNNDGKVEKVQIFPEGKQATVTFENIEVAITAASTTQVIENTPATVTLLDNEKEIVEKTPPGVLAKTEETRSPAVKTPIDSTESPEASTRREKQTLGGPLAENPSEAKVDKITPSSVNPFFLVRQVDQVFSLVSAIVQPEILKTAPENFLTAVFNVIQTSCGVQCQRCVYGIMLTGTLSQVAKAGELLDLRWRRQCQDLQSRNVGHDTNMNQAGTHMNQAGTHMNQAGMNMNQAGMNMNQAGMNMNQDGKSATQRGAPFNPRDTSFHQSNMHGCSTSINQPSINFTEPAITMSQVGPPFNQTYTNLNQNFPVFPKCLPDTTFTNGSTNSSINFTQHGTTFNQSATTNSFGFDPMRSGHAFCPTAVFNQQNVNYSSDARYQQSRENRQWANYARDSQHHHLDSDARYGQPGASKQLGLKEGTESCQSLGNTPDMHQYTGGSSCSGEANPRSGQPQKSYLFGNPSYQQQTFVEQNKASQNMIDQTSVTPLTSTGTTKTPQPIENAQNGIITNDTTGEAATKESSASDTTGYQKEKSPISPTTNPSSNPPVSNQPSSLTPNVSSEHKISTTSSNHIDSLPNDTADSVSKKTHTIANESTTYQQSEVDNRESKTLNTGSQANNFTTSNNPHEPHLNEKKSDGPDENQPGSPKTTKSAPPQEEDQPNRTTDHFPGPQNPANSNNTEGSSSNDKPDTATEKSPADNATPLQKTSHDQTSATQNPDATKTSDKKTVTPLTNTSGSLDEKRSDVTETPNNKQPTHNEKTQNHENPKVDITPTNHAAFKPDVPQRKLADQSENFNDSEENQAPVPKPRHNKPATNKCRQNAAKFSSSTVKIIQPGHDSPTPTELKNNSLNDNPADVTEPKEEGDQKGTTQSLKTSKTTEERKDKIEYEMD